VNKWPGLEKIDVSGILNVTNQSLSALSHCPNLKSVNFDKIGLINEEGTRVEQLFCLI